MTMQIYLHDEIRDSLRRLRVSSAPRKDDPVTFWRDNRPFATDICVTVISRYESKAIQLIAISDKTETSEHDRALEAINTSHCVRNDRFGDIKFTIPGVELY